jgi:hypothetical protein
MALKIVRICSGCGKDFPELERQLDGKDYCSIGCFMEYNSPCEYCGNAVPINEGVHHKDGYTLCWDCATDTNSGTQTKTEITDNRRVFTMANMSYCRFRNTAQALDDCLTALDPNENEWQLSDEEENAGIEMFKRFLEFCAENEIIGDYSTDRIAGAFDRHSAEIRSRASRRDNGRISLYEKNRNAVYATGNKWAIENWEATH